MIDWRSPVLQGRVRCRVALSSTARCVEASLLNLDFISCPGPQRLTAATSHPSHKPDDHHHEQSMATQRLAGGFQPTSKRVADEPSPSQRHAKKPKKTVSVAGLFAKRPRPEREKIASTDGITRKQPTAEELLTARAKRDPIYLDVKRTQSRCHSCELC